MEYWGSLEGLCLLTFDISLKLNRPMVAMVHITHSADDLSMGEAVIVWDMA